MEKIIEGFHLFFVRSSSGRRGRSTNQIRCVRLVAKVELQVPERLANNAASHNFTAV